ncbi:secE [Wigglesworthia glossinidia endosymbiont of Glossina brevipalpis]|uniref:Protein translocase subunit SecE n=1 Tax=Wigglesworthia glossinidia brevipalpis TaxID=36870 RepID=Q8D239_WIGBR|nr:secE [Wigglesworthia glossinidia endosymbiont of Glossina brevipalpis]
MKNIQKKNKFNPKKDFFIWVFVVALLFIASFFKEIFPNLNKIIKFLIILIIIISIIFLSSITNKGKYVLNFIQESLKEIKKVAWPSLQETLQTTLIVSLVTVIMSLLLWGLDSLLIRAISFITSLRF